MSKPYLDRNGRMVVPLDVPRRFRWWDRPRDNQEQQDRINRCRREVGLKCPSEDERAAVSGEKNGPRDERPDAGSQAAVRNAPSALQGYEESCEIDGITF